MNGDDRGNWTEKRQTIVGGVVIQVDWQLFYFSWKGNLAPEQGLYFFRSGNWNFNNFCPLGRSDKEIGFLNNQEDFHSKFNQFIGKIKLISSDSSGSSPS